MAERLFDWPDDPRLARAFADVCVTAKYDSWRTHAFYLPVLEAISRLGDKRAAERLRSNDGGLRGYYRKSPLARQRGVVAALDELPLPALAADEERALAELERSFSAEAAAARTQEELFEAVLAAPDDAGARAVWADVLLARGDPRGELVVLMLAEEEGRGTARGPRVGARVPGAHALRGAGQRGAVAPRLALLGRVEALAADGPLELARWMLALRGAARPPRRVSRASFLRARLPAAGLEEASASLERIAAHHLGS